ncbi:gamma-aminobutyric acid receptor subunit beta-like [Mizuhopecten yessoensis]|uniref:Gamma-aminobutyric acid receptor subunit beta n=1 Tax=Mizuhopecten yessoensis TaxID=6573 RepID=A0A210PXS9_MIZYE|nr:gamma-aminobutyric acid receptor subunit beta-like [Mizuhopecten yessoensis]OWF41283.1 Gamma-aminobutyric acid receptor subunit beta [Mizuhopecten yessoensis]
MVVRQVDLQDVMEMFGRVTAFLLLLYADIYRASDTVPLANTSATIEDMLEGYDIRLRPNFGGERLDIGIELIIASFDTISEVDMDYTITIYLNQYWADDRLAFARHKHGTPMTLTGDFAEKIWVPDTFFANDKNSFLHEVTEKNKMIRLYGNGSVVYGMRFTTTLACMMDLHNYPLDEQNCTVEIESYGYDFHDLYPHWRNGKESVQGVDKVQLPQFDIVEYRTIEKIESLSTGDYPRLSLSFKLHRNVGYFIFQTYLPSILIVMLSWVSFWINHEATSARVALGITTVLTMTTISNGVRSSLPRISYVKAIDIYLVMCFVFVFAALLEYAAVNYTFWGARAKKKTKKFKDGLITLQQPVDDEPDVVDETPLESEEVQMSPIVAIRNSQGTKITIEEEHMETPPNIPDLPRTCMSRGYLHDDLVRRKHNSTVNKKKKYYTSVKQRAKKFKVRLPRVKDVNNIDRYSRLLFPLLFLLFNVCYWGFYLL